MAGKSGLSGGNIIYPDTFVFFRGPLFQQDVVQPSSCTGLSNRVSFSGEYIAMGVSVETLVGRNVWSSASPSKLN